MPKKIEYNNILYAFDIETTTTKHNVVHYLSNFNSINFNTGELGQPHFCRTWQDVNDFLFKLNLIAVKNKSYYICYVHNLAYEFDGLIKNVDFVKSNFKNENALFLKSRIPLFVRCDRIEFRCSYKFFNNSLKNVGLYIGLDKLDIDYKAKYYTFSKLPTKEYDYNRRDVEIVLKGIFYEKSKWDWINTVNDLPLTSTGLTRKNNKKINSRKANREIFYYCNYQKKFDENFIDFLEKVFSGGYTHANAFNVGKVLQNVYSYDLISSYPAVMLLKEFPCRFREYTGTYKTEHLRVIFRSNLEYVKEYGTYKKRFKNYFLAKITIHGITAKNINNNYILPISASKCEDLQNIKIDNGRILKAETVTLYCTETDLYNIYLFYDFNLKNIKCERLLTTTYTRQLPEFIINSVKQYLYEKSTLKQINKKLENNEDIKPDDFFNKELNGFIYDDDKINNLLADSAELESDIHSLYAKSKEKLNSNYGINVQKLLPLLYRYNINDDSYTEEKETKLPVNLTRDFITGLYVTSFARDSLFTLGYKLASAGVSLVYSDTDSWKITGNKKIIDKVVNDFNKEVRNNGSERLYHIGEFDFEGSYDYFSTLGCKKYLTINDNIVTSTIAGIGKKETSQNLTTFLQELNYDYQLFYDLAFTPLTIFDFSITGKLISKYHHNTYNMVVTDVNGDFGTVTGVNMVELCESDFILMNTSNKMNKYFIYYCEQLQNRIIASDPILIFKRGDKIKYKYLTNEEFKNLRLYEVAEKDGENIVEH